MFRFRIELIPNEKSKSFSPPLAIKIIFPIFPLYKYPINLDDYVGIRELFINRTKLLGE